MGDKAEKIIKLKTESPNLTGKEIAKRLGVTPQYVSEVLTLNNLPTNRHIKFPALIFVHTTTEDKQEIKSEAKSMGLSTSGFIRVLWRLWKEHLLRQKN